MLQNKDEHAINMYLYQYYETLYEFNDSTNFISTNVKPLNVRMKS